MKITKKQQKLEIKSQKCFNMKSKFLIIESDPRGNEKVQNLLDEGYQIEKMEALHIHSTSQYSNTVYGRLAVYLTKAD